MSWYDEACCLVTRRGVGSVILASWVFVERTVGLVALLGSRQYELLLIAVGLVLTLSAVLAWTTPTAMGAENHPPPYSVSGLYCRGVDHTSIEIALRVVSQLKKKRFGSLICD